MSNWRVVVTITHLYDNRANALSALDAIVAKVPSHWEIRTEEVRRE